MRLRCACCGGAAFGKQWYNRDRGYGICMPCADMVLRKEGAEALERGYGISGIHFKGEPTNKPVSEPDYFTSHATGEKVLLPKE